MTERFSSLHSEEDWNVYIVEIPTISSTGDATYVIHKWASVYLCVCVQRGEGRS